MNTMALIKTAGGLQLSNNVKLVSEGYDGYKVSGSQTIIPRHSYVEANTARNSQENLVRLEDGAVLDMSKATAEMTRTAYELSLVQYPNAGKDAVQEEKRKEYVWAVLQKMIENPDLLKEDPEPSEEIMLPRTKPEARMQQPPRAAEQGTFKLKLKKRKKPAAPPPTVKLVKKAAIQDQTPPPEPPKPINLAKLLQIPGLDYKVGKPVVEVVFDFGALGKQRARYHWVGVAEKTLNLIFDSRFKMMDAYVPAQIDDADHVTEVSISTTDGDKQYHYRCWGTIVTMEFGIFRIIQLVLVKDELGARLHEENEDGQDGDDRSGADSGGGGWADPGAQAAQQEGLRIATREPRL